MSVPSHANVPARLYDMHLINLHASNTINIGDRLCAPSLYFDLKAVRRDLAQPDQGGSTVILGGGGLMHSSFTGHIERHLKAYKVRAIAWGVGTNTHGVSFAKHPDWVKRCELVGLRDDTADYSWVPCVSCMDPEFDRQETPKFEAVVYRHGAAQDNIPDTQALPTLTNHATKLSDVVSFLLSGQYVITNTYHGMYWATLLQRQVIVYPFSSRHCQTRHRPVLMAQGKHWKNGFSQAQLYSGALEECRAANWAFSRKVLDWLGG